VLPRRLRARTHRIANELIQRGWAKLRYTGAIAPGTRAAEAFGTFGEGSVIAFPTSTLYGERQIHLGTGTMISTWCTLAAGYSPDQDTVPPRALVIGDRCVIGMRSGIIAHESIEIGDDVWFGQEVFVTDANHGYADPDTPIGDQLGPHEPVRIGAGSWLGHGVVVLPGTTIGRNVVVAAGSVVRGTIEDHAVIGGVPARVIRRYVPGTGWERADGGPGVKVPSPTVAPEDLEAALAELEASIADRTPPPAADAVDETDTVLVDDGVDGVDQARR
jgi:carbonic anhydrase/acetyltransferase-like protein (isoleucine patch superfamily)